jgi:hypothetical protein
MTTFKVLGRALRTVVGVSALILIAVLASAVVPILLLLTCAGFCKENNE